MKILAFIPARAGSKGIKNKNMANLKGKPLIYYTLKVVKKINKNVYPFVSTDSNIIKKYCKKNGFKDEYFRPKKLSTDKSYVLNAIFDALKWLNKKKNLNFDAVMLLNPTSPIRKKQEIDKIINIFRKGKIQSIVSVSKMKEHPFECIKLDNNKWKYLQSSKKILTRRQSYPNKYFFIDGSIYLSKISFLKKYKSFVVENKTKLFRSSQFPSIDIDDPADLRIAKLFI